MSLGLTKLLEAPWHALCPMGCGPCLPTAWRSNSVPSNRQRRHDSGLCTGVLLRRHRCIRDACLVLTRPQSSQLPHPICMAAAPGSLYAGIHYAFVRFREGVSAAIRPALPVAVHRDVWGSRLPWVFCGRSWARRPPTRSFVDWRKYRLDYCFCFAGPPPIGALVAAGAMLNVACAEFLLRRSRKAVFGPYPPHVAFSPDPRRRGADALLLIASARPGSKVCGCLVSSAAGCGSPRLCCRSWSSPRSFTTTCGADTRTSNSTPPLTYKHAPIVWRLEYR